MFYLLLRLPGAAAHALEQHERGWRNLPFYGDGLILTKDTPGKKDAANDTRGVGE